MQKRTFNAIRHRAYKFNLRFKEDDWTEEEKNILITYYHIKGEKIFQELPNRTIGSCRTMASKLNLKRDGRNKFSEEEDNKLKELYPIYGPDCYIYFKNRTIGSIRGQARKLNLKMNHRPTGEIWTEEELQILKEYYPTEGTNCIIRLPNRTKETIKRYARINRIKYNGQSKLKGTTHRTWGSKKVQCVETGEIFESLRATGLRHIGECCKNPILTSGGYHWKYVEDDNENN